jgi:hypothetical protein
MSLCCYTTIGGGLCNFLNSEYSTIGGGLNNSNAPVAGRSTISGGEKNCVKCEFDVIGGGCNNTTLNCNSIIGGGISNTTTGSTSSILGGQQNTSIGILSTIGGGAFNKSIGDYTSIGGGSCNTTTSTFSTISGGANNTGGCGSSIGGGLCNSSNGNYSMIGGGYRNTSSGSYSSILGGSGNTVTHNCSGAFGLGVTSISANTFHVNNLALQDVPATDVQTTTQYLTRDSATGVVKTKIIAGPAAYGLYAQTGDSVAVSATTGSTTILNGGVGTLTVPANGFTVGDSFLAKLGGVISAKVNDTLTINVVSSGVTLTSSGPITMPNITNKVWLMEVTFTIRKLGAATVGSIVSLGNFVWSNNVNVQEGFGFNTVNSTTFDTTISNTLDIKVQWSSASTDNSIYSDVFVLTKTY